MRLYRQLRCCELVLTSEAKKQGMKKGSWNYYYNDETIVGKRVKTLWANFLNVAVIYACISNSKSKKEKKEKDLEAAKYALYDRQVQAWVANGKSFN